MRIQSRLHHTPADMVGKARTQQGKPVSGTDMQSLHLSFYCGTKLHISHSLNVKTVCEELRRDIIDELADNPGHFASSLGVVELTVALHYVYDTPYDRIVWDVGHQAYGHKILTGRRERFSTNRKLHGLKPFPSPSESEYDTFTCGRQ